MSILEVSGLITLVVLFAAGGYALWRYAPPGLRKWLVLAYGLFGAVVLWRLLPRDTRPDNVTPFPDLPSKPTLDTRAHKRADTTAEVLDDEIQALDTPAGPDDTPLDRDSALSDLAMRDR